uniref:hypothetical protein n=1 Tax=Gemmiger qucibialis TaxID=2997294 RepID=UPI003FF014BA
CACAARTPALFFIIYSLFFQPKAAFVACFNALDIPLRLSTQCIHLFHGENVENSVESVEN